MSQTAEAEAEAEERPVPVNVRGRRPGVPTLDTRLEELEETLTTKSKISNKRLAEMHEAAVLLEYHYEGHKENGTRGLNPRLKRVEQVINDLAARTEEPSTKPSNTTGSNGATNTSARDAVVEQIRSIRSKREEIQGRIEKLQREEEDLYTEVGRLAVEELLGS